MGRATKDTATLQCCLVECHKAKNLITSLQHDLWLQAVVDVWQLFQTEFLRLWDDQGHKGDAYPAVLFGHEVPEGKKSHQVKCSACFKLS